MPSLDKYDVEMKPYSVGGWWTLEVFVVNDPEVDATHSIFDIYLNERDQESLGIQMAHFPIRMSAEKWIKTYTSDNRIIPLTIVERLTKVLPNFWNEATKGV